MIDPAPELPDNTLIESVRLSQRIRNLLNSAGVKTVGEIRDKADAEFLSLPSVDKDSLLFLRRTLGLPSSQGVSCLPSELRDSDDEIKSKDP